MYGAVPRVIGTRALQEFRQPLRRSPIGTRVSAAAGEAGQRLGRPLAKIVAADAIRIQIRGHVKVRRAEADKRNADVGPLARIWRGATRAEDREAYRLPLARLRPWIAFAASSAVLAAALPGCGDSASKTRRQPTHTAGGVASASPAPAR